ncbi:MAG: hydrogenase maturation protease [Nocardioides sp.]|nr:hydrogenase maturation protease [Nocardioides sp.]
MDSPLLVAGIGNLFLTDDGFGPEVVRRLVERGPVPGDVRVVDYGIRGMHLAFDLLDGYAALVIVDAMPVGRERGDVTVLEVGPDDLAGGEFDAHGMNPVAVLGSLDSLGGTLPPTYVVGCRPLSLDEGIGLSAPVAAAVPVALDEILALVDRLAGTERPARAGSGRR